MSQFKRFNASENDNWNTNDAYPQGTLTWDPDNGLRIHDGSTSGGNAIGGGDPYWSDIQNKPNGNTAVHDLIGGASSLDNGKYLKQTTLGVSEWSTLPTTYDTLTIDTKIIGGIDGAGGTQITGIEATLGYGVPYRYAFISGNDAFGNLFNRGSALVGWKMYPANDPSAFVTITEFLNNDLGAPSLGFDGSLAEGPWVAESSDYSAGANGPLTLSADTKNWVLGTDGILTLPAGGYIKNSDGINIVPQGLGLGDSPEFAGLYINGSSGNEGGQIRLALPANTGLGGDGIGIDIFQNKLRIFENGGTARGVYIDLTTAEADVGTNLLAGGGSGTTLPLDATGVLKNDGTGTLSWSTLDIQDLTDTGNVLNFTQTQADWTENNAASPAYIQNRPTIITSYNQLEDKPTLFDGSYLNLTGTPSLSAVATTGMYGDLSGTPTSLADFTNDPGFVSGTPWQFEGYATSTSLATVATSGSYNDLSNTPTVPTDVSDLTDNNSLLPAAQVRVITKNDNFTAEAGKTYWLDSGTSAKTMTLPASPTAGDWVKVYDGSLNWTTYNLTVSGNGNQIRTVNMMGAPGWNSAANTVTLNQNAISPNGPLAAMFIWNGTNWYSAA